MNYASTMTAQNMEFQASLSYLEKLSLSGGHSKGSQSVDTNFKQNSLVKEVYYGGNANLITGSNGFQNWCDSAQRNPWIFGGQLTSILNIIPEGPKKIALNTAYNVKLDFAYLDELSLSLRLLKRNPAIDMAIANNLVNQIGALRGQVILSHAAVEKTHIRKTLQSYNVLIASKMTIFVEQTRVLNNNNDMLDIPTN
jgi:hypothetical protein